MHQETERVHDMLQAELDKGGEAFMKLASDKGYGSFVDIDSARGVAAVVLRAAEKVRQSADAKAGVLRADRPLNPAGSAPSHMIEQTQMGTTDSVDHLAVDTLAHHMRNAERWVREVAHAVVTAGASK